MKRLILVGVVVTALFIWTRDVYFVVCMCYLAIVILAQSKKGGSQPHSEE